MTKHFIVLSRLDGSPVWIVADKIERIHDDVDDRTGSVIHLDSGQCISVLETPAAVVRTIEIFMVPVSARAGALTQRKS
jgi:uncharacterized protein YlzI (FlbEa/FlbD family)